MAQAGENLPAINVHPSAYLLSIGRKPNVDAIFVNCSNGYSQRRQHIREVSFALSHQKLRWETTPTLTQKVHTSDDVT